jgi:hypothetical protein
MKGVPTSFDAAALNWRYQERNSENVAALLLLGGVVVTVGLVELANDDRAEFYGAFLTVAAKRRGDDREQALLLWRRKGKRAFDSEA